MAFKLQKTRYTGRIREITIGTGDKAITVGGATSYPFYLFEGEMPHPPKIAMEVYDMKPEEWPEAAVEPFKDVLDDPVAWAQKCIDEYKADAIALILASTDPNGMNRPAEEAVEIVKKVVNAVDVPVIVWGSTNEEKDNEVLQLVAEACEGKNVALGPVVEGNYKQIGARAIGYKHVVIASTPIDVNLAKQLNILLGNLGVPEDKVVVDPTTGGLGYGIEYSYSVMERDRMAALTQEDVQLQYPIVNCLAKEVWKVKEVFISEEEDPKLGDPKKRGVIMEAMTAMLLLLAGSDLLIMRHPEAVELVREMISDLTKDRVTEGVEVVEAAAAAPPKEEKPAPPPAPEAPAPAAASPKAEEKPAAPPAPEAPASAAASSKSEEKPAPPEAKPAAEAKPGEKAPPAAPSQPPEPPEKEKVEKKPPEKPEVPPAIPGVRLSPTVLKKAHQVFSLLQDIVEELMPEEERPPKRPPAKAEAVPAKPKAPKEAPPKKVEKKPPEELSADKATVDMIKVAREAKISTVFDRAAEIRPCPIGAAGSCCKHCSMGPCRVVPGKDGEEKRGVCGATASTIAARNFARMVAGGASAHSDHGRAVAEMFLLAAKGEVPGYTIKDEQKLLQLAFDFGIDVEGKDIQEIAVEVGERCLAEFGKQEGEIVFIKRAPLKRQEIWRQLGIVPRGIDREIVEIMHRTHIGVDQDFEDICMKMNRCAIGDGWGGSMISTELQDILFGTPVPVIGQANLGVLSEDKVNIIVHGHEPLLSEMIAVAVQDPELEALASKVGAKGINLAGMCCTANEILMRHGIPIAGNFLQQELAVITGAVEAMILDIQCEMQGLEEVCKCFHTKLITTSPKAKIRGAQHIEFDEHNALESAKNIVKLAIENFPNRDKSKVIIPDATADMVAGFSHETIDYLLGGLFRASYRPLNDNIINGRIRGVAGVVGCNNARTVHDSDHLILIKELLKNDVLVLTTGCGAIACAKDGLMHPVKALEYCGDGLRSVCEAVGIPPVLHMGSCVDNSRILVAATAMVKDGGLGDDISDLPVAGAAPEWMSEKAISIGQYFVASGVFTVFGTTWPVSDNKAVCDMLFNRFEETLKGKWAFEPDPYKMAQLMLEHIDKKRKELGIDKARERVLMDMAARRALED